MTTRTRTGKSTASALPTARGGATQPPAVLRQQPAEGRGGRRGSGRSRLRATADAAAARSMRPRSPRRSLLELPRPPRSCPDHAYDLPMMSELALADVDEAMRTIDIARLRRSQTSAERPSSGLAALLGRRLLDGEALVAALLALPDWTRDGLSITRTFPAARLARCDRARQRDRRGGGAPEPSPRHLDHRYRNVTCRRPRRRGRRTNSKIRPRKGGGARPGRDNQPGGVEMVGAGDALGSTEPGETGTPRGYRRSRWQQPCLQPRCSRPARKA